MDEVDRQVRKTRRSQKKIKPNTSTHNRVGYKATKVFSNQPMLYGRATHEHWPSGHMLMKLPATQEGASIVLDQILLKDVGVNVSVPRRMKDNLSDLKILLLKLMKTHRRLSPYSYIFTHHLKRQSKNKAEDQQQQAMRIMQPLDQRLVSGFVTEVLRKVVPLGLLGCNHNARVFKRFCRKLVNSGKSQNFRLGSLMSDLKITRVPWLNSVTESALKMNIFAKVVTWLLEEFVFVLLKTQFYITEGLQQRNKLLFYRPRVQQKISDQALLELIRSKKLQPVDKERAAVLAKTDTFPGKGVLRFVPKKTGPRPIVKIRPNNSHTIKIALTFLTQVTALNPVSIKPTASDMLHKMWCTLFDRWNQNDRHKIYFVRTDILDAYGSMRHEKLCDILKHNISAGQTYTLKCFKFFTLKKEKSRYIYKQAFDHLPYAMPKDSILIDKESTTVCQIVGRDMLSFLCEMLQSYVVHRGNRQFLMTCGQPQGARLSSVLCDLYYSDVDRTQLREFQNDNDLLIRAVDDYLYVTTNLDRAVCFLEKMEKGFPEYGCYVNAKTLTNVPRERESFCTEVTYCGYVMDTELLHITRDYARYKNQDIAHSMCLTEVKQPGKFLQKRMGLLSSLKLNALTLDELYNSREIVLSNIFHAALLQAFRFHSIVKCTFDRKNLNQRFLTQIVYESAGKIGGQVLRITNNYCRVSTVDFSTVCWIVYRAFYLRMSSVCSYYPDVLKATDWILQCLSQRIKADHYDEIRKLTLNMPDVFHTVK